MYDFGLGFLMSGFRGAGISDCGLGCRSYHCRGFGFRISLFMRSSHQMCMFSKNLFNWQRSKRREQNRASKRLSESLGASKSCRENQT